MNPGSRRAGPLPEHLPREDKVHAAPCRCPTCGGALRRHAANASPIAKEPLDRIGQLYRVEETINGALPDERRRERQQRSKPIAEALRVWAEEGVRYFV